jgi:hypothetical protein
MPSAPWSRPWVGSGRLRSLAALTARTCASDLQTITEVAMYLISSSGAGAYERCASCGGRMSWW